MGVLSLQSSISGLAAAGGQIFVLCRVGSSGSIARLSVHPSLVKLKSSPFLNVRYFVGNLSAASSRSSSREALDQLHTHTVQFEGRSSPKPELRGQKEERLSPGDAVARFEEQPKTPVDQGETEKLRTLEGQTEKQELQQPEAEGVADKFKTFGRGEETVERATGGRCGGDVGVDKTQVNEAVEKDDIVEEMCVDQEGVVKCGADVHNNIGEKQAEEEEEEEQEGQVKKEGTGESGLLEETKIDEVTEETDMAAVETSTKLSIEESESDQLNIGTSQESSKQSNVFTTDSSSEISSSVKSPHNDTKTSPSEELETERDSNSIPDNSKGKSIIPTLALVHGITHVKADLKEIKDALKLGKLTEFISQATSHSPILQHKTDHTTTFSVGSNEVVKLPGNPMSDDKEDIPTPVVVDPEEQQRWLRMAEMAERDEDVVVATKSPSKVRKTRKRKTKKSSKHSSATSEFHVCTNVAIYLNNVYPSWTWCLYKKYYIM